MIKLKRNSLVYRYINFAKDAPRSEPKTICSLFWAVIFSTIRHIIKLAILVLIILISGLLILYPIWQFFVSLSLEDQKTLILCSGFVWIIIGGLLFIGARENVPDTFVIFRINDRSSKASKVEGEEKQPNWFFEWIKAKKRKVCPLIEWEGR